MYQTFVASLVCPGCGSISPADESTGMQTGELTIGGEPPLRLAVGDRFLMSEEGLPYAKFYIVRARQPGEPLRLLQSWECPTCGARGLWAIVTLEQRGDGDEVELTSIEPAPRTSATLNSVHAVSGSIVDELAFGAGDAWLERIRAAIEVPSAGG